MVGAPVERGLVKRAGKAPCISLREKRGAVKRARQAPCISLREKRGKQVLHFDFCTSAWLDYTLRGFVLSISEESP